MIPELGCSHAEEVEWVVGITEESGERGTGQGVSSWRWRQSHAGSEGAVGWVVVQVDADAMSVLGVLKQKPGTGEGLLTRSTDVAGWLIFFSSLLFGADPFGWGQPPLLILLPSRGHLDAHFHRNSPSSQLQ